MRKIPYFGVTDFTSYEQVKQALACIPTSLDRRLHVGVMASYKTVTGIKTETGWENIWPRGESLRSIFQPNQRVFYVLHYADSGNPSFTTADHLVKICKEAGPYLHGLQLDMVWPDVALIQEFKDTFPDLEVIVQISSKALEQLSSNRMHLDECVSRYAEEGVDYFLIDMSMGKGVPMDVQLVVDIAKELSGVVSLDSIAVAGGIGPETYYNLRPVFNWSNVISCDAQGKMRSSGLATDPIEMDRVCAYLRGVSSLV